MQEFKFTNKAISDLSEIWEYTFEIWSEQQADNYYKTILDECKRLSNKKARIYENISTTLRGFQINKHIISYRIIDDHVIEIERILHKKMNLRKPFEK